MQQDLGSILAYALYFIVLFAIGLYHMKDTGDMQSYMLGGRKIGPWVSAMSAEASDMSGWMLMGLPGYAYVKTVLTIPAKFCVLYPPFSFLFSF